MQTSIPLAPSSSLHERLSAALTYDHLSGELRWTFTKGRCCKGAVAGTVGLNGYRYIRFEGVSYLAHRLVWFLARRAWPAGEIDHIDRDRLNNAISNLRDTDRSMNNGNTGIWKTNTSGFRGVSWDRRRNYWCAYIWRRDRKVHLGRFDHLDDAAAAYDRAAIEYFGEFASLNGVSA